MHESPVALTGAAAKLRMMSGDIEAIGAAVTAGLVGGAIEPAHGGGHGDMAGGRCLNCGTSLIGSHCYRCGQKAAVHRSFTVIGHDLVHAIFHFEGKLWNTLPLLAWRPGDLTRRFIHGERARFISPLSLFLFAVFLTYAVLASVGNGMNTDEFLENPADSVGWSDAVDKGFAENLAVVDAKLARPGLTAAERKDLVEQRAAIETSKDMLRIGHLPGAGGANASAPPAAKPGEGAPTGNAFLSDVNVDTGVPLIDHGVEKARKNPSLLFYKLQANAYKFAWALIPLSMPFLWLLYPFSRRFRAYDHFVFVTYSISFMLLLFVVARLLNLTIFGNFMTFMALCYVPFHMYRQLRGAYRSSRFGSLVRTLLLLLFSLFAVMAFMLLLLALGVMG